MEFAASGIRLEEFGRFLGQEYGVSVVITADLLGRPVTIDSHGLPLTQVLRLVARQLDTSVSVEGLGENQVYIFGELSDADRAHAVLRVGRTSISEARELLSTLVSADGQVMVFEDGLCVVLDTPAGVNRALAVLADLREAAPVSWCLQLYIIRDAHTKLKDVGVDLTPSAELAYTVAALSASGGASEINGGITAGLDAVVRAAANDSVSCGVWAPVLLMADGQQSEYSDATSVLVPQYVVDQQSGRVAQSGFTTVSAGLVIKGQVRETGQDSGRLNVEIELRGIDSYVEGRPIVAGKTLSTAVDVADGGLYLLGEVGSVDSADSRKRLLMIGRTKSIQSSSVTVWGRVFKVAAKKGNSNGTPVMDAQVQERSQERATGPGVGSSAGADVGRDAPAVEDVPDVDGSNGRASNRIGETGSAGRGRPNGVAPSNGFGVGKPGAHVGPGNGLQAVPVGRDNQDTSDARANPASGIGSTDLRSAFGLGQSAPGSDFRAPDIITGEQRGARIGSGSGGSGNPTN